MSATTWSKVRGRAALQERFQFRKREFDRIEVWTVLTLAPKRDRA